MAPLQDDLESMRARHAAQLKMLEVGFEREKKEAQRMNDEKVVQISALRAEVLRRGGGGTGGSGGLLGLKEDAREPQQHVVQHVAALERRVYSDREHFSEIQIRLRVLEQSVELEETLQSTFAAFSDVQMQLECYKQRCTLCDGRLSVVGGCNMSDVGMDSKFVALAVPHMAARQKDGVEDDALASASPCPAVKEASVNDISWAEGQTRRIRGRVSTKPRIDCWRPKGTGTTLKTPQGPGVRCMPMHRAKFSTSSVTGSKSPLSSFRDAARSQLRRCVCVAACVLWRQRMNPGLLTQEFRSNNARCFVFSVVAHAGRRCMSLPLYLNDAISCSPRTNVAMPTPAAKGAPPPSLAP